MARRLPQLCKGEDAAWINVVSDDARVSYARADAASLPFADASKTSWSSPSSPTSCRPRRRATSCARLIASSNRAARGHRDGL